MGSACPVRGRSASNSWTRHGGPQKTTISATRTRPETRRAGPEPGFRSEGGVARRTSPSSDSEPEILRRTQAPGWGTRQRERRPGTTVGATGTTDQASATSGEASG